MKSSFGKNIIITIEGGSHEDQISVEINGLPKEMFSQNQINMAQLQEFMNRRAPGNSPFASPRKEPDIPEMICENPLKFIIKNTNRRSTDYKNVRHTPRPGHADFTAFMKYGDSINMAGGGPFSARMTAPLCIAGGIAIQILKQKGIEIGAHIFSIKDVYDEPFNPSMEQLPSIEDISFPVLSQNQGEKMQKEILNAKEASDSVGGIVEAAVTGLPAGLGGPMYDGVESFLSPILFGIPAVKGVEFGTGFGASILKGSENNDEFFVENDKVITHTNHHGGILGGITSGMPLITRVAFKPTPSIGIEQNSVDLDTMKNTKLSISGRHDPCVVLRAVPIVEAALAIGILDMILEK